MGVSIIMDGKDITPVHGAGMMADLVHENFDEYLDLRNIPRLEELRDVQRKGLIDPPFDWYVDVAKAFDKIIERVRKRGEVKVKIGY